MAQILALYRMPCPSGFAFETSRCIKRGEEMDVQIECAEHIEEVTAIAGEMIDEGALFVIDE